MSKKPINLTAIESKHAATLSNVMQTFNKTLTDLFDNSLDSFFEFKPLHPQQQLCISEYNAFLKVQLKNSISIWNLLLNSYSFFLDREDERIEIPPLNNDNDDTNNI